MEVGTSPSPLRDQSANSHLNMQSNGFFTTGEHLELWHLQNSENTIIPSLRTNSTCRPCISSKPAKLALIIPTSFVESQRRHTRLGAQSIALNPRHARLRADVCVAISDGVRIPPTSLHYNFRSCVSQVDNSRPIFSQHSDPILLLSLLCPHLNIFELATSTSLVEHSARSRCACR